MSIEVLPGMIFTAGRTSTTRKGLPHPGLIGSVLSLLIFTACGSIIPSRATPTPTAIGPSAGQVVLIYTTSGGITGLSHTMTVYSDGLVIGDHCQPHIVDARNVTKLREDLLADGFTTQAKDMPDPTTCMDCTQTDLTLYVDGQPVTLSVINEANDTPEAAKEMVSLVEEFIFLPTSR